MLSLMEKKIAMTNYHILKNLPQEFLDLIKEEWLIAKPNLKNSADFRYVVADKNQDYVLINKSHKIYDIVNKFISVPNEGLSFLINNPNTGLGPVHIDASRMCAINIPLEVDFINSCFFIENQECTERPFHNQDGQLHPGTKRFLYEPQKYDYYNSREPVLMNTKKTHGFFNYSNNSRVLFSISFTRPYEEVLSEIISND